MPVYFTNIPKAKLQVRSILDQKHVIIDGVNDMYVSVVVGSVVCVLHSSQQVTNPH